MSPSGKKKNVTANIFQAGKEATPRGAGPGHNAGRFGEGNPHVGSRREPWVPIGALLSASLCGFCKNVGNWSVRSLLPRRVTPPPQPRSAPPTASRAWREAVSCSGVAVVLYGGVGSGKDIQGSPWRLQGSRGPFVFGPRPF